MARLRHIVLPLCWLAGGAVAAKEFQITAEDRAHWAFQPVKEPAIPGVAKEDMIDALVRARLAENGLSMNPPATKRELIRRACFDLIGLPPAPEEVGAFDRDESPDAWEKLIDRLLARPQYGERWGRHWLDVVRFAQSNGYERDGEKLLAWRYRDYVIRAFNEDKPYDRFVREQIAGDELPDATADSVAATGFQRLGVFDDEPDDTRMAEFDALDDIVSTTGAAFLGLTIGCARCHDHKLDPVSQSDYYSLLAFFRGVRPFKSDAPSMEAPGYAPLASPAEVRQRRAAGRTAVPPAPFEFTLAVRENGPAPPATRILFRGNPATEGPPVDPAFPQILCQEKPSVPPAAPDATSSGRRLILANWLADSRHPLTARVLVNRAWHYHFGKGIVRTTTDFGRAGSPPTHPELIDFLAADFVHSGWSLKKLHKRIMLSQTYRQSSRADRADAVAADPGNDLLWRQNLRRLEAEPLRDAVLSVAGTLNLTPGGRGFFPHLGGEVLAGQSRPGLDWEDSSDVEQSRRSVYAFVRRTMAVPLLEIFDYSNTTSPLTERVVTTVAPQALMLLNDEFMHRQAAAFAARLVREAGDDAESRIRRAWQLALSRDPSPEEAKTARDWLARQTKAFAALSSRLTFRNDVPGALATAYFTQLQPSHFLSGPREGWSLHRGFWAPPYEGIRVVDRQRGPFALWQGAKSRDVVIEAEVTLPESSEFAGLLFCASARDDNARGYELCFDLRNQRITLRRNGEQTVTMAETVTRLTAGMPFHLKMESRDGRIRAWLHGESKPLLETADANPVSEGGMFGVRTWGGALWLDRLTIRPAVENAGAPAAIPSGAAAPEIQALQSLCLLVLNLNAFVYVD